VKKNEHIGKSKMLLKKRVIQTQALEKLLMSSSLELNNMGADVLFQLLE